MTMAYTPRKLSPGDRYQFTQTAENGTVVAIVTITVTGWPISPGMVSFTLHYEFPSTGMPEITTPEITTATLDLKNMIEGTKAKALNASYNLLYSEGPGTSQYVVFRGSARACELYAANWDNDKAHWTMEPSRAVPPHFAPTPH